MTECGKRREEISTTEFIGCAGANQAGRVEFGVERPSHYWKAPDQ